jgi:hypothetical protein
MQELFKALPRKWKLAILKVLDKAKIELPLIGEDIDSLQLTLQEAE